MAGWSGELDALKPEWGAVTPGASFATHARARLDHQAHRGPDRDFTAARQNQRWVGATTELRIGESGKLYLAAVLDLFSLGGCSTDHRTRSATSAANGAISMSMLARSRADRYAFRSSTLITVQG